MCVQSGDAIEVLSAAGSGGQIQHHITDAHATRRTTARTRSGSRALSAATRTATIRGVDAQVRRSSASASAGCSTCACACACACAVPLYTQLTTQHLRASQSRKRQQMMTQTEHLTTQRIRRAWGEQQMKANIERGVQMKKSALVCGLPDQLINENDMNMNTQTGTPAMG